MSNTPSTDITFELLILQQLAAQPRPYLSPAHTACLRSSTFWVQPPKVQVRSTPLWQAAAMAGMIAMSPLGWLPVYAESTLRIGMSVIDARSGKPLTDAKVFNERGVLLGVTGSDGKLILSVPLSTTQRLTIEKPGYRSFPVIRTQLRDNNLIAMVPAPAAVAVAPTAAPVPTPRPVLTPQVPDHPVSTPKPTTRPTPVPTPRPILTPVPTPKPILTPKPTPRPVPTAKPLVATPRPVPRVVSTPEVSAPEPARRARTTAATKGLRYVVQHGDSLWTIARREYGDGSRWKILYEVNQPPIRKAHLLRPGMVLTLPSLAQRGVQGRIRVVRQGDCLWLIAERQLGNGERWREIYQLNRRKVRNPRLIYPGQRLVLPPG